MYRNPPLVRAFWPLFYTALFVGAAGCGCEEDPGLDPLEPDPVVDASWNRGFYLDMALDGEGDPWLAYQDRDTTALNIAHGTGDPVEFTHWAVDGHGAAEGGMLVGAFDGGYYASVAVSPEGSVHATHWSRDNDGQLRHAVRQGDSWTTTVVDYGGVGQFTSLGLRNGEPIVAYYNYDDRALKVAWKSEQTWSNETVDAGELTQDGIDDGATLADVGRYADLLVTADGTTYIAYFDHANGNLKVAVGGPGNWTVDTWYGEGTGRAGAWPNLSEAGGAVHVAFQDETASAVLFGQWTGAELAPAAGSTTGLTVAARQFVGPDPATAWVSGSPVIMYHDGVENDALLATMGPEGWTSTIFAADGAVGFHNQMAADDSGNVNWACFNHSTTDISFQRFTP